MQWLSKLFLLTRPQFEKWQLFTLAGILNAVKSNRQLLSLYIFIASPYKSNNFLAN